MKLPLDHIGFLGADTEQLAATFRKLGFHVVGPAALSTSSSTNNLPPPVQRSAHIMFADSYIELTAVNPCPPDHHLAAFQGQPEAIRLLLLGTDDAAQTAVRLSSAGVAVSELAEASRQLSYRQRERAEFRWFSLAGEPIPQTLTAFVEHLSRDAVFDSTVNRHPNGVRGIDALYHQPGSIPEILCDGPGGLVNLIESEATDSRAFFTGIGLLASNLSLCEQILRKNRVPFERKQDSLRISAAHAAGAFLQIEESP